MIIYFDDEFGEDFGGVDGEEGANAGGGDCYTQEDDHFLHADEAENFMDGDDGAVTRFLDSVSGGNTEEHVAGVNATDKAEESFVADIFGKVCGDDRGLAAAKSGEEGGDKTHTCGGGGWLENGFGGDS